MDHLFDEFSKSLGESVPRRESLRRLGGVFAGAVLGSLGLETAWAGKQDACNAICKCSKKAQQSQCLKVCRVCHSDTSRVCGSCGSYVCCAAGQTCCSGHCTDLHNDVHNCGVCGKSCGAPPVNEYVACVSGLCTYDCVAGAVDCDGTCTFLESDPDNCGACGNICGGSTPYCSQGACTDCGGFGAAICNGVCVDIFSDALNCGACGRQCAANEYCSFGHCYQPSSGF